LFLFVFFCFLASKLARDYVSNEQKHGLFHAYSFFYASTATRRLVNFFLQSRLLHFYRRICRTDVALTEKLYAVRCDNATRWPAISRHSMGWNPLRIGESDTGTIAETVQCMDVCAPHTPALRVCADCESTLCAASAFLDAKRKKLKFATPYEPDG
jgi:hypothetical protein